ncbi:iron ABC transporter ATP-binding protein [Pseudomonas sp. G11-1]|uniref:ABC transporter ATP-binding protein n=1 Tax=Halopseudomonas bauzanensis TaxID=653930 RepID=A0A4U0YRM8_9GAMM|nr:MULTISPECIES: ABC transporter ATP-binding protein [Halopseudomonas]MCO5785653.1 iron ABC transporter ATP-binding protein [Pseudomonas sp. G11-1]MCO5788243.1 iron ABC transporter ATP-binding protein [Pseudomonas sp. G11-2]EZQ19585.1 iron ABC transporter ATP-binding protein [Halopseudomonas bauzanensis]TKA93289.1 ABC transporter ATP-binding protein [Halopseudomonas bauzanensis]WGK61247.1 ABC transporter ATP-binding protein [Halopseudomonas sp. SMJS2]
MIETRGVSKRYGDVLVVDDVSLSIPRGGFTSIIGPNGAGKSTLLSMISRLTPMSAGSVQVDGMDVTRTPGNVLARRLSILRQDNQTSLRLTVRDLVAFGRFPHSGGRLTAEDLRHVDEAMDYLRLGDYRDRPIDELSGGQRQRAYVAMVMCQDTEYVLLDEPLNNIDMRFAVDMMQLLRRAADEKGKTVVVVLHDINFASCYSDHIIAMRQGRPAYQGSPQEIIRDEVLRDLYEMDIQVHEVNGQRICTYYR